MERGRAKDARVGGVACRARCRRGLTGASMETSVVGASVVEASVVEASTEASAREGDVSGVEALRFSASIFDARFVAFIAFVLSFAGEISDETGAEGEMSDVGVAAELRSMGVSDGAAEGI